MSIANLDGSDIFVDDIIAKSIDTPLTSDNLLVGTVKANSVVIGRALHTTDINGALRANNIDVNLAIGGTLFIGSTNMVDCAIGKVGGNPITVNPGILTNGINRGGSLGAGSLAIGDAVSTTSLLIGQPAAPISLIASSLTFPATTAPLAISQSRAVVNKLVDYSGGVVQVGGARVSFYRLGDFVHLQVHSITTVTNAANTINPISMIGALDVGYRPTSQLSTFGGCFDLSIITPALIVIFPNGSITVGRSDNNHFSTTGSQASIMDFSFSFNVNV